MRKRLNLDSRDAHALLHLHKAAVDGLGRERMGVRGWLLREEVEQALGLGIPERLSRLVRRQFLDRDDVRAPHLTRPVWLYRIAASGIDALAAHFSREFEQPAPLGCRGEADAWYYIPPPSAAALEQLKVAQAEGRASTYLPGEVGWMSVREIRDAIQPPTRGDLPGWAERERRFPWEKRTDDWKDAEGDEDEDDVESDAGWDPLGGDLPSGPLPEIPGGRLPYGEDLEWLVTAGLVQRWIVAEPGRRPVAVYRATTVEGTYRLGQ